MDSTSGKTILTIIMLTSKPVAVDSCEKFVFAAGQDNRICAWSLGSGQPLGPLTPNSSSPLAQNFQNSVTEMQLIEDSGYTTLWAASGKDLMVYELGARKGISQ